MQQSSATSWLHRTVQCGGTRRSSPDPSLYLRSGSGFARPVADTLPYHSDSQFNFHICIYQSGSSHNSVGCYLVRHDSSSTSRLCYSCTSFIRPRLRLTARETMRTLPLYRTRNQWRVGWGIPWETPIVPLIESSPDPNPPRNTKATPYHQNCWPARKTLSCSLRG